MDWPSGDQRGSTSSAGVVVRLVRPGASAFTTYISQLPSRLDANAMDCPSGDQAGQHPSAGLLVRLVRPVPSAFTTYSLLGLPTDTPNESPSDLRSACIDLNVMNWPSGD